MSRGFLINSTDKVAVTGLAAPSGNFSLALRVFPQWNGVTHDDNTVFSWGTASGTYSLYVSTGGGVANFYTTVSDWVAGTRPVAVNRWSDVILSLTGTTLSLYVNGTLDTSAGVGTISWGSTTLLGRRVDGGTSVPTLWGALADVGFWSAALDAADAASYHAGNQANTIKRASVTGCWPLRGVTSPEPDLSTSNGVLGGTPNGHSGVVTGTLRGWDPPLVYPTSPQVFGAAGTTYFVEPLLTTSVNFSQSASGSTFNGGTADPTTGLAQSTAYPVVVSGSSSVTLGWSAARSAAHYYFSAAGNDTNAGTIGSPWKTTSKANSYGLVSGDTFSFNGGDTFAAPLAPTVLLASNDTTALTVLDSYGSGQASFLIGNPSPTVDGVLISNAGAVTVNNLAVAGGGVTYTPGSPQGSTSYGWATPGSDTASIYRACVRFENGGPMPLPAVAVTNCVLKDYINGAAAFAGQLSGASSVQFSGTSYAGYDGISFAGNTVTRLLQFGLSTESFGTLAMNYHANVSVTGNNVTLVYGDSNFTANSSGYGLYIGCCSVGTIGGASGKNFVADCGGASYSGNSGGPVCIELVQCDAVTVSFNEGCRQSAPEGADGGMVDFDAGCVNCVAYKNYSHDNAGAGYQQGSFGPFRDNFNNTFAFNVSENDDTFSANATAGVAYREFTAGHVSGSKVYQNVFYSTSGSASHRLIYAPNAGIIFANNIFVIGGTTSSFGNSASVTLNGNLYDASGGSFSFTFNGTNYASRAALNVATGQEASGQQAAAALKNAGGGGTLGYGVPNSTMTAYDPAAGSPAIGAGLNLTAVYGINPGTTDWHSRALALASLPQGTSVGPFTPGSLPVLVHLLSAGLNAGYRTEVA